MSLASEPTTSLAPGADGVPPLDPGLHRVLTRVRLRAKRRVAWLRKLWNEELAPGDTFAITHSEMDAHLDDRDAPAAEAEWCASEEALAPLNQQLAEVEAAMAADATSRLARLHRIFGLTRRESDLLQACLGVALDPAVARIYAYLQDHAGRAYVTEALVARLFGHGHERVWTADCALRRWELVTEREVGPIDPPRLACDLHVLDWLQGRSGLDETLISRARLHPPRAPLAGWAVEETSAFVDRAVHEGREGVRVRVVGVPGGGRRTFAAAVSARLGLSLLVVDSDAVEEPEWERVFRRAQRHAYLEGIAPAWEGQGVLRYRWPRGIPCFPLQFVICEAGAVPPPAPELVDHAVEIPPPTLGERRELWQQYVPAVARWPREALDLLVTGHRVPIGEIAAVARHAVGTPEAAAALVRERVRHRLGNLAQRLECPFRWDDLVVSDRVREALEDFVFEARERTGFWERPEARRLFPQGRGLLALFTGVPGTGKTMAAQVIAASLGLDLFRIDLSSVVSKYVGETSQNLERILSRAAHADVVLLFDEADALFGKRTEINDAHDRFANTDTNYLLQAIESYVGVAILATNQKENMDPAFTRRIRYVVDFPMPDAAQRHRIWQQVLTELAGREAAAGLARDLEALAHGLELAGAQIKFALLAAIFAARRDGEPVGRRHLLRGLDRELVKEGRGVSDRDRQRMFDRGR